MPVTIDPSWHEQMASEFERSYFGELTEFVKNQYSRHSCYPPENKIYAAFDYTPFDQVKVVILGQDPYHGLKQANGLCFSVQDNMDHPPSLKNIYKELKDDMGIEIPESGNLERWASQGVLLLNATLTVKANSAGSHQKKGWEKFTDAVIAKISAEHEGVVFLLWGGYAKRKGAKVNAEKHLVLTSGHPSPLSANRGYWFGNKHFSKTNEYLESQGKSTINW